MIREALSSLVGSVLLACLCLCFAACVEAQSRSIGPDSGQIVQIRPNEPKGSLKVIRAKGAEPVKATEKMLVRRGDLLNLDPKASAIVLCGDNTRRKLEPGLQPCPCTAPCSPEICGIKYAGSKMRPTRGGTDTFNSPYPVVISPRATLLLTTKPTIQWTPIGKPGEKITYKVTVHGENMSVIWSRYVDSTTRLAYPNEAPLKPGQTYKVLVTAAGLSSAAERLPWLGFAILTQDQARALADERMKRKQLELSEAETCFLISTLYAARELYAEAIDQLEDQYNTSREPVVARMLGDLYAEIGLHREAAKKYSESLELQEPDDFAGVGLTQKGLVTTYESLGMFDKAVETLEEAIKAYERLGDSVEVEELKQQAQRLKRKS